MLHLMYITNKPWVAKIAEHAGVDWIFVDMEWIGKNVRQNGLDTVQNHHTFTDVKIIKNAVTTSKVLVRVNPIHNAVDNYPSSKDEIEKTIDAGADIIMLPFFKTVDEVKEFIDIIDGRVKTCLLLETPEAATVLKEIVQVPGIDMVHIGLNDMHLALGMKFMFELLADGSVDKWSKIIKNKNIPFGFGGLASLDGGAVAGKMILKEHYRLGSSMVILSRAFCNTDIITDPEDVKRIFNKGLRDIRELEDEASHSSYQYFSENRQAVIKAINTFVNDNYK